MPQNSYEQSRESLRPEERIGEVIISVIIPTYNRCEVLAGLCLEALARQTFPAPYFEVLVIDDGSQDDTLEKVARFRQGSQLFLEYLRQTNQGQGAARNQAIQRARGKFMLFINDDIIPTSTLLSEHAAFHQQYPEENVAILGRVTISPDLPPSLFAKVHLDGFFHLLQDKRELDWRAFYTCNISVKKTFLTQKGLFSEDLRYHEDLELGARLSRHNLRVIYNPQALGYHYHFLEEADYFALAELDGEAHAKWYLQSPHLKQELALSGFYLTDSYLRRIKCFLGDLLFNPYTRPFLIKLARYLASPQESAALILYRMIYQSFKRERVRKMLTSQKS
jgi:glycosyltransferase involved in cell wall biosynthesis